jgi:hypothetical protein
MAIDDARLHAAPGELVGEHQAGRAGADDENVDIHVCISLRHVGHGHHPCGFREGRSRLRQDKSRDLAYTSTAFPMLTGTLVTIMGFVPVGFAGCSLTTRLQQCGFCG